MITVTHVSCDRSRTRRRYKTLAAARRYAHERVGPHPEFGSGYAVSDDGISTIYVEGTTLAALFPERGSEPGRREADRIDGYDRDDLGHSPDY
jgi:hypothetical protein